METGLPTLGRPEQIQEARSYRKIYVFRFYIVPPQKKRLGGENREFPPVEDELFTVPLPRDQRSQVPSDATEEIPDW